MSYKNHHPAGKLRLLLYLASLTCAGCSGLLDGSFYDTFHIPKQRLREIRPLDLESLKKQPKQSNSFEKEPTSKMKPPEELNLTVEEARAAALRNNLDLQIQLFNPEIAEENLSEAKAAFEPLAFSHFNFAKTDTPTSVELEASKVESIDSDIGVVLPLHTGGEVRFTVPFNRTETNTEFQFATMNPSYTSDLNVSINQPLLRGAWFRSNTHAIRIARYGLQAAQVRTKLEVIRVIAMVDRAYWRLYAARQQLKVRKQEYDLAVAQRESAQRKLNADQVAKIEVLRAEEAAAQRLEGIISAQNQLKDRKRELKKLLNKPGLGVDSPTKIVLTTPPNPVHYTLDKKRLLEYALKHRMELLELELQLASDQSTIEYERNRLLPVLSLNYTYNVNGLGPEAEDAFDVLLDNKFVDHAVGLALQIPIGNRAAESRLRKAVAQRRQSIATKERRKLLIKQEVLNAAEQLQTNWQRVLATRKSTQLAKRTLQAEKRRFELGLQTSTEVLDAQTRFASAQLAETRALTEYQIAIVDTAYAAGSILGAARVKWDPEKNVLSPVPPKEP